MVTNPDIRQIILPNDLQLVCRDETRRYFGDYFLVRVQLSLPVPLEPGFFRDENEYRVARSLLPDPVVYSRSAERMGVPSEDVETVRTALIDDLLRHAGKYLGSSQFPLRFIQAEVTRARSGKSRKNEIPVFRGA